MDKNNIPVLLLTGYLGSGKTTLVNRILSNRRGIKFAVIVNDIGEVNIDADLIQKGGVVGKKDDSLVALQNGCICCTLKMDLVEQLSDIARTGKFDYIVIEASGICEPAPIAQTICSIPQLGPKYVTEHMPVLDCIVTVVDALRMQSEFACGDALKKENIDDEDLENLVIQQIEFCNIVVLNKVSEVKPEELDRIRKIVRALQPKAEIIECDWGDVDFDKILHTGMFDFEKVATSAAWIDAIEGDGKAEEEADHDDDDDDDDDDDHDHEEHEHHHHHHHDHEGGEVEEYNIGTFVYYRRPALDINLFDRLVAKNWPKGIIRAKGICWFADEPDKCYVFEQAGVQKSLKDAGYWYATMPEDKLKAMLASEPGLRRDWDETYGDRMVKIVFIGQNLDKKAIAEAMDKCLEQPLMM
jgi:G3E family GTPase